MSDGVAGLRVAGPGRLRATVTGTFYDILNPCPITWPLIYDSLGNPVDEDVGPFPAINDVQIVLPMAQLKDASKPTVEVSGGRGRNATEFCSAAGSNNGGQCGPEETVSVTGTKIHLWRLTLTRVPRP